MVSTPYPGHTGRYFSMPVRNVVPKPVQKPHPPLWVACTNRDTLKMAARLGMGALTFSFMDAGEARFWVREYYETFKRDCVPIGQSVNPNIAMLAGVLCHEDTPTALAQGLTGQQFFKWALAHYYRFGAHIPGQTSLWAEFLKAQAEPMAGVGAVGDPAQVRQHFREFEDAGVDQVILLVQGGNYLHEHICESLDLLGRAVLPEFRDRHPAGHTHKMRELAPFVESALSRVAPLEPLDPPVVDAYPRLWERDGAGDEQVGTQRALDAASLWRLHVGSQGGGDSR
jgi:alkanesulfonate monooxygenase SsuD/methylene tetrahydromethanopterin reductase-like flavin-dependent oxidoreductase (luciferase family)